MSEELKNTNAQTGAEAWLWSQIYAWRDSMQAEYETKHKQKLQLKEELHNG